MALLVTLLWIAGYLNTTILVFVIKTKKDYSSQDIVMCALFWPLLALVILYLMLFYRKKP